MPKQQLTWLGKATFVVVSGAFMAAGAVMHAACEDVKGAKASSQKPEDLAEVLAKIDDVIITVGEFQERINKQSPYVRARYTSLERKKEFLDNLVRFEVLAKEAQRRGLDKDAEVVRTMKQVMIQKLLKDEFDKQRVEDITDDECKKYYDAHPEQYNKPEEVRVSSILVKDAATAQEGDERSRASRASTTSSSATSSPSTRRIWRPRIAAATCATSTPRPRTSPRRSSTPPSRCRTSATSRRR